MTIDVQLRSLRYASTHLAELFGFGPITMREWQTRANNVFGPRLYLNASSGIIAGRLTPRWDEASAKQHALQVPDDVDLLPLGMPDPVPTGVAKIAYLAKLGVRMIATFRGYKAEVVQLERTELAERIAPTALGGMTSEQLAVRLRLAIDRHAQALSGKSVQRAVRYMQQREQARTIAVRWTDQVRRIEQELGRRAVAAGKLREVSDVFYLTVDGLLADRRDALALVGRRRLERDRLAKLVAPVHFSRHWEPTATPDELMTGGKLFGLGVSAGIVEGIVRIIRTPDEADLDPGEVLVATVTDVGCTPLFAVAAAVVTDVGGMMSHASIVAREFGIPCVVHTQNATTRLRDGQRIRVDGTTGTVEVLTD